MERCSTGRISYVPCCMFSCLFLFFIHFRWAALISNGRRMPLTRTSITCSSCLSLETVPSAKLGLISVSIIKITTSVCFNSSLISHWQYLSAYRLQPFLISLFFFLFNPQFPVSLRGRLFHVGVRVYRRHWLQGEDGLPPRQTC